MMNSIKDCKMAKELIPRCPICGKEMEMNLRIDSRFVEDEGWYKAKDRYVNFINENKNKKILFLEFGVGMNTPSIIKFPFMKMIYEFKRAFYIPININRSYVPEEIEGKSVIIQDDISKIINAL